MWTRTLWTGRTGRIAIDHARPVGLATRRLLLLHRDPGDLDRSAARLSNPLIDLRFDPVLGCHFRFCGHKASTLEIVYECILLYVIVDEK